MHRKNMIMMLAALAMMVCSYACGGEDSQNAGNAEPAVQDPASETRNASEAAEPDGQTTGFLVLAPDRGFMGNEEIRDAFAGFAADYNAGLAFVTGEDYEGNVHEALRSLEDGGADTVWVLPLFLSDSDIRFKKGMDALGNYTGKASLGVTEYFGESYLAEEILRDRASALSRSPSEETLIVIGSGAVDKEGEQDIKDDLERIVRGADAGLGFKDTEVLVLYSWDAGDGPKYGSAERVRERIASSSSGGDRVVIVPFNLAMKLTGMMSEWNMFQHSLAGLPGVVFDGGDVMPHEYVSLWFRKKANERLPFSDEEIGVVYMPHGSDYNWNEQMREAVRPLEDKYLIEEAFSMGDRNLVERAVGKLEAGGAKAIVVLRVFSLESSFRDNMENMLGLKGDTADPNEHHKPGHHGRGHTHDHHGHGSGMSSSRIASSSLFVTLGGLEDDPLFAEAMADRVMALSTDPQNETVILLGHGTYDDETNDHWHANLKSLADQIRNLTGAQFRDIEYYTWREDWPDKREKAVEVIRAMVEKASADGGTAIVIPVRTTGEGPEEKYLGRLEYRHGTGFAPHPNYVKWVESKIQEGVESLRQSIEDRHSTKSGLDN